MKLCPKECTIAVSMAQPALVSDAPHFTPLAEHHHFESIEGALIHGADIIPKMQKIQCFPQPRRVADTESRDAIRSEIAVLKRLVAAYQEYVI